MIVLIGIVLFAATVSLAAAPSTAFAEVCVRCIFLLRICSDRASGNTLILRATPCSGSLGPAAAPSTTALLAWWALALLEFGSILATAGIVCRVMRCGSNFVSRCVLGSSSVFVRSSPLISTLKLRRVLGLIIVGVVMAGCAAMILALPRLVLRRRRLPIPCLGRLISTR